MSLSLRNHPHFNSAPRSCTNSDSDTLFAEIWLQSVFYFFVSRAIVQSQSVWKALWGSLWLEMKIAFGNPTKRINFDFISGLFSKLIINLPAGPVPSTCLVGEGGNGPCETRRVREPWSCLGWKKHLEIPCVSQISNISPNFKTSLCSVALPTTKALHLCKFLLRAAFLFEKVLKHVLSSCLNLLDSA